MRSRRDVTVVRLVQVSGCVLVGPVVLVGGATFLCLVLLSEPMSLGLLHCPAVCTQTSCGFSPARTLCACCCVVAPYETE